MPPTPPDGGGPYSEPTMSFRYSEMLVVLIVVLVLLLILIRRWTRR